MIRAAEQLKDNELKLNRQSLLEQRKDLSPFLIHLTRDGNLRRAHELYSLEKDDWVPIKAKNSLINILQNRRIEARSMFGYFKFKVRYLRADGSIRNENSQVQHDWLKAVCFTETPIDHVYLQTQHIYGRQLHFQPYGLAFREEIVLRRNGNPVFYFSSSNTLLKHSLDQMSIASDCRRYRGVMPLFQEFGTPLFRRENIDEIDFRWEREWRIGGDFSFSFSDVAFGLCPANESKHFETLVDNQFPFVDPCADVKKTKNELRKWPGLDGIK